MPKLKTHRGAAKRFKVLKSGRVKANRANHNHILTKKSMKRKRRLRSGLFVSKTDMGRIKAMLPNA